MKLDMSGAGRQSMGGMGPRARRKAERPDQILEAAFEEFVLKGYAATRVEDIAARIGITKGTVYFYFGSKELLFEKAIQVVGAAPLAKFIEEAPPWTDDILKDLRTYLGAVYRFIAENPSTTETLRLLLAESRSFPELVDSYFRNFMDPVALRLGARLEQAATAKQIKAYPFYLVDLILAPPFAHYMMTVLFGSKGGLRTWDGEQLFDAQIKLLLNGLLSDEKDLKKIGKTKSKTRT